MPVAWTKSYQDGRIFCTTMGSATDLTNEGVRRLLVNATYWAVGLENAIEADANVDIVGKFEPTEYGFGTYKRGVKPSEHRLSDPRQ